MPRLSVHSPLGPLTIVVDTLPVLGRAGVSLEKVESLGLSLTETEKALAEEAPAP